MNRKIIIIMCSILLLSIFPNFPSTATVCSHLDGHQICLLRLKRSAKYYWEYRVLITVDGKKRPMAIYNCRERYYTERDRTVIPFQTNDIGNLICNLVNRRSFSEH
jgi:hypothetical protein